MSFDEGTINRVFGLTEMDSNEFYALYREANYYLILQYLTDGKVQWSRNENQEVMAFPRVGLIEAAKVWFYFVFMKLVPSKRLSKIGRDKALLTYAIIKGYKFNVGEEIENSILKSTYHKAMTHPILNYKIM